jgi:hypothetical protein
MLLKLRAFRRWARRRPFVGGVLVALSGIELFFSGQLDIGKIHVQLGIEGFQATILPILLLVLGVLIVAMPAHRIFYGVIALAVAVYSLIGVNLGGFFVGMLLGAVGGVLVVSWMPKPAVPDGPSSASGTEATDPAPEGLEGAATLEAEDDENEEPRLPLARGRR